MVGRQPVKVVQPPTFAATPAALVATLAACAARPTGLRRPAKLHAIYSGEGQETPHSMRPGSHRLTEFEEWESCLSDPSPTDRQWTSDRRRPDIHQSRNDAGRLYALGQHLLCWNMLLGELTPLLGPLREDAAHPQEYPPVTANGPRRSITPAARCPTFWFS